MSSWSRRRWVLTLLASVPIAAFVAMAGVIVVAAGGDVPYAWRVVSNGDSSPDDVSWRQTLRIVPDVAAPTSRGTSACVPADADVMTNAASIVVRADGDAQCEWHAGTTNDLHAAFSISKPVVGLLLAREQVHGRAPANGDSIVRTVPELLDNDERFERVTIGSLIDMRSGIGFSQEVSFPWVNSDNAQVYYSSDVVKTITTRPQIESDPGHFQYNDYAPNLLGLAYERTGGSTMVDEPLRTLWRELGAAHPVEWVLDDHGFPHYESGLVVHPTDLSLLGQELLDALSGSTSTVFPSTLVTELQEAQHDGPATSFGTVQVGFTNGWWLFPRPDGSVDYAAMGDHGQLLLVSPADGTVLVRLGDDVPGKTNVDLVRELQRFSNTLGH